MPRNSWIVTKPRPADSRPSPRLAEPFVVTIVEPTHFQVPGDAHGSTFSNNSLLTTDTASNQEGSMSSSPGSSENTSTKSQVFRKHYLSPRSLAHVEDSIPVPQRPPRWSDGDESLQYVSPSSAGFVKNSRAIPEGITFPKTNTDVCRTTPSAFEKMEVSESGDGSALATSRWHHVCEVHNPLKRDGSTDISADSLAKLENNHTSERDTRRPNSHDLNVRIYRDSPSGKQNWDGSDETSSAQTRAHNDAQEDQPSVPCFSVLRSPNDGTRSREIDPCVVDQSLPQNKLRPIARTREDEVDFSTKSSPRSDDVERLQEDCESPLSESFYTLSDEPSQRSTYSNLKFEKVTSELDAMMLSCGRGRVIVSPFASPLLAGQGSAPKLETVFSLADNAGGSNTSCPGQTLHKEDKQHEAQISFPAVNDAWKAHVPASGSTESNEKSIPRSAGTRKPTHNKNQPNENNASVRGDLRYPQTSEELELESFENDGEAVDCRRPMSRLEAISLKQTNYKDLITGNPDVRRLVAKLEEIARSGSIETLRDMLGIDGAQEGQEADQVGSQNSDADKELRPDHATTRHSRQETAFFDAYESPYSGDSDSRDESERMAPQCLPDHVSGLENNERLLSDEVENVGRHVTAEVADVAERLHMFVQQSQRMRLEESSQAPSAEHVPIVCAPVASENCRVDPSVTSTNGSQRSESSKSRSTLNKLASILPKKFKRSKGSRASFSSRQDSDGQTDSLPSSRLNALDEDVTLYRSVEPSREPDGSGSLAMPPHPLHEISSARQMASSIYEDKESRASSSEFSTSKRSDKQQFCSDAAPPQCVLKLSFCMQDSQSPASNNLSGTNRRPRHSRTSSKRRDHAKSTSSQLLPEPSISVAGGYVSPRVEAYRPTNDVSQILQSTKKDCKTWVGPLTEAEINFYLKFNGKWKANWSLSDSYDSLCEVMELGWIFRKGLDASDIIVFEHSKEECKSIAKIVGLLNLTEKRPWVGTVVRHNRRDHRRGHSDCWVERYDGGFIMRVNWENPLGGTIYEFVELTADHQKLILRQDLYRSEGGLSSHIRIIFDRVG